MGHQFVLEKESLTGVRFTLTGQPEQVRSEGQHVKDSEMVEVTSFQYTAA